MSDALIAVLIVPFLIVLTLALECSRIGCTWLSRRVRPARKPAQTNLVEEGSRERA